MQQPQKIALLGVKYLVAVASGKGGVGKSTVAANLALALRAQGQRVGLMDADIYGPSVPIMMGLQGVNPQTTPFPMEKFGLKLMSMGFIVPPTQAVIWRGPMVHRAVTQFLTDIDWGQLDYLIIDLPPGCLTADTWVPTDEGAVPINEVRVGSHVYSFSGQLTKKGGKSPRQMDAALVKRKVLAVIPQGKAQVYELRTPTRCIRGTADHPILVLHRSRQGLSRFYGYSLEWRHLAQLQPGDVVLTVKKLPQESGRSLPLPLLNAKSRAPLHIPERSSPELLRLVGYCLGDGTVRLSSSGSYWGVWFSEPEGGAYRPTYIQLLRDLFEAPHVHQQPNKFAVLSTQVGELFDKLGLHEKVLEKTLPSWVFTLPEAEKLALLEGYCDADGHWRVARPGHRRAGWMCFASPNKRLLEGLRALCLDVGLKAGNLTHRTRQVRLPSTGLRVTQTFYGFEANRTAKTDRYGAGLIRGPLVGKGLRHEHIGFEKVKAVKAVGLEEVYDLQVEGEHNFVANGLIVHNTGDAQLTLTQTAPLSGAVIVTTPQDVSLIDARKGLEMFRQVRVPVLGIVENMSFFVGEDGKRYEIFRHGGGQKLAAEAGVPFLGDLPIDPRVAECGDTGEPIVHKYPDSPVAKAYLALAATVAGSLARGGQEPELPGLRM
jgi:Mrp family chromosome partitioning ATPase